MRLSGGDDTHQKALRHTPWVFVLGEVTAWTCSGRWSLVLLLSNFDVSPPKKKVESGLGLNHDVATACSLLKPAISFFFFDL